MTKKFSWLAASILAYSLTACGNKTPEEYVSQAQQQLQAGSVSAAVIELKNALKADAKYAPARLMLGRLYLNQGAAQLAIKELERAEQYGSDLNQTLPLLARARLLAEQTLPLSEMSTQGLNPDTANTVKAYIAIAQIKLNQLEQARASYTELTPNKPETFLAQGYIKAAENKLSEATAAADSALELDDKLIDAFFLRAQLAALQADYESAVKYFTLYQEAQPLQQTTTLLLANSQLALGDFDAAVKTLQPVLKAYPKQGFANAIMAAVHYRNKEFDQAQQTAEISLSSGMQLTQTRFIAGVSAFRLDKFEQAYQHLSGIVDELPEDHMGRKVMALTQLKLGYTDEVESSITQMSLDDQQDAGFLAEMGNQFARRGLLDKAIDYIAKSNAITPSGKAQAQLGVLKIWNKDYSGLDDLEAALEIDPNLKEAELALALIEAKRGNFDKALSTAQKWQQKYPDSPDGYNMEAYAMIAQGKEDAGRAALERSLKVKPDYPATVTFMSQLELKARRFDSAIDMLKKALKTYPNNPMLLLKTAHAYRLKEEPENAVKLMEDAHQASPDDMRVKLLLAQQYRPEKRYKDIIKLLKDEKADAQLPRNYWLLLSNAYIDDKQVEKGGDILKTWLKLSPDNSDANVSNIYYLERMGKFTQAAKLIEKFRAKGSDSAQLSVWHAKLEVKAGKAITAQKIMDGLSEEDKKHPQSMLVQGHIYNSKKRLPQAAAAYLESYENSQNREAATFYATSLLKQNKQKQATEFLEAHLEKFPTDVPSSSLLANIYLSSDKAKAVSQYTQLVEYSPNNLVALNNLAWLLMEDNKLEQATKYAKKATAIAPENANALDTYGSILLKSGQPDKALEQFQTADKVTASTNEEIRLHLAEALLELNQKDKARRILEKLAPSSPTLVEKKDKLMLRL